LFLRRMPSFWHYFYSVYNSHRHYLAPPVAEAELPKLPWREIALAA